ncbi:MAG: DUF4276 family protein [Desulfoprunum sp.]
MKLYVEGGGDAVALKTACRAGFSEFLRKAGLRGCMPRIVACGSRQNAYDSFCTAVAAGEEALLLVDSESAVAAEWQQGGDEEWLPWRHLRDRQGDQWQKPAGAAEQDCHLMVQCMEAWFLADRETLRAFFGPGLNLNALPAEGNPLETIAKDRVYRALADATRNCTTKAQYGKGEHSFKLLRLIAPEKVTAASAWAKRFVDMVRERMGC